MPGNMKSRAIALADRAIAIWADVGREGVAKADTVIGNKNQ